MSDLLAESPASVAEVMMNRVNAALVAAGSDELFEVYVVLGELAWDECCGTLVGAPLRTFRSASFPQPLTTQTNCEIYDLAVDIVIILLRCMPSIDESNYIPTPEEMDEASHRISRDASIVMRALSFDPMPEGWERANVEQTIQGADGGCIAIDTRMTVGLPQSDWCIADPEVD